MTRATQSFDLRIALLTLAVCVVATTARLAAAERPVAPAAAVLAVAAPALSFEGGAAPTAGTQVGFCGGKRANSPARSLCKKLKRGVSPESGQSPVLFVESIRLRLTALDTTEAAPDVTLVPDGTPPDLSLRAPPAL